MEQTFTKAIDIIYLAKQNDVDIILNGDQLQLKVAENKTVDDDLLKEIRANKKLIIDFLSNDNWQSKVVSNGSHKICSFNRDHPEHIPLSFSQERLWFIDRLEGSLEYHLPIVLRLTGTLDRSALAKALQEIVNRHEVLRTVYHEENGQVYQRIKAAGSWTLKESDGNGYQNNQNGLESYIRSLTEAPFDLSADDMFRAELIRLAPDDYVLVTTLHHIASDASSMPVLVREVAALYSAYTAGEEASLPPLTLQYADYAVWQREHIRGAFLEEKLKYWKQKLEDAAPLELPADHQPSANNIGSTLFFEISAQLARQVQTLARQNGATLYMTLLAAFKVLLYRYSGQEDICVGTSVAGRPQQELEELIGFFVNTLALRDQVTGEMPFTELLAEVKNTTLEAYAHQDVPFEKVVEAVVKERIAGKSPLFQVMLVLNNTPEVPELKLGELVLSEQGYEQTISKFDLTFFIKETKAGFQVAVQYNTGLYAEERIQKMAGHFKELLQSVVTAPETAIGKLEILSKAEQSELTSFEQSHATYPKDKTIAQLFEQQAKANPDTIAIAFEETKLSYKALNERSNQLAHYLQSKGVKENTLVPLLTERGTDMLIGILGILKAGGAYVPVDTDFPQDRISYMLEDTKATVVVTTSAVSDKLPPGLNLDIIELDEERTTLRQQPTTTPATNHEPNNLAYIIYTSGSTGKPKGVEITNQNITDYVYGLEERIHLSESKSFALVSSIATDLGNTVLYGSMLTGGTLHVFTKETVSHIEALHEYFDNHEIDCLKIVPSHWKALMLDNQPLLPKKQLIFGGEALQKTIVETIQATQTTTRIINHYGPTETTIGKLVHEVDKTSNSYGATIPVGKPFSNTKTYIFSKELTLCPIGVPGQLYIAGDGLAKGYLNNPELTKEKFIEHPTTGERMYATGDKVQYQQDGNILFIGRVDDQVKIRGYRVEPGEIGRILEQSEHISQAIVITKDDKQGNKQLIGYIIPKEDYDKQELQAYLKEQLPDYMVPAHIIALDSFPLTANGKIDRRALPDPEATTTAQYTAPRNETEAKLSAIWQDVLELDQIGITDDFFGIGGHSLLAVRLISMIRKAFGMELPISDIFDYPTVEKLAARLTSDASTDILPPVTAEQPRPEYIPLSFSQERLWFIDRLEGSSQYHQPAVLRLKGELNKTALAQTLRTVIDRHEVLRTVIREHDGRGYQQVIPANNWTLNITEASDYQENTSILSKYIAELISQPFNLSKDYMLRAELIKVDQEDHILVVTTHHIASDGWSRAILVKEVVDIYEASLAVNGVKLPDLSVQYADYAIWQRKYMQDKVLDDRLGYWKNKLDDVATLELPSDYSRPPVQRLRGATLGFGIDETLSSQLQVLSHQNGTTLYMTLLAVFKVLLYRYSGQEDICVGTTVAGRPQQELEGLIGFFINTLALRSQVRGNMPFTELLQAIKDTTLEAYSHQEVPFEKVVDAVVKGRDASRHPLFQVLFTLQNTPEIPELKLGGLSLNAESQEHVTSRFDIAFMVKETGKGIHVTIEYNTDLYREERIAAMTTHFRELLLSVTEKPETAVGELEILSKKERNQLFAFGNSAFLRPVSTTIAELFEEQAARNPDNIALIFEEHQLSFRELNEQSNQLAHYLQGKGVKEDTLVPLLIERGADMLIGILGILKAGGAYVPINTDFPIDRINYILEDTKARIVVSSSTVKDKLPPNPAINVIRLDEEKVIIEKQSTATPTTNLQPGNLAYVIYTSGSTGKPKGVEISHCNVVDYVYGLDERIKISESKSFALVSTIATDLGNTVLYSSLLFGGALHVLSQDKVNHIEELHEYFNQHEIDCLKIVPSHWKALMMDGQPLLPGKQLIFGGEALQKTVVETIDASGATCQIINHYGPTETTIGKLLHKVSDRKAYGPIIPIGKPFSNTKTYILNKELSLCPVGIPGQLYIAGEGLARGYLNNERLTHEQFVPNPFDKERYTLMYATGDKVQYQPDGNILFIGRVDDQVKIRGYRVEPGEIGLILEKSGLVSQAIVLAREDKQGNKQLVGYVVSKPGCDKQQLQEYLKKQLPDYMIPAHLVELSSMPLTQNGKIDRRGLPDPETTTTGGYIAPRNGVETEMAAIWQNVLELDEISITDDFFELGGHSLLAVRLISAIRKIFGMELPISDVFDYPTVALLAARLTTDASKDVLPPVTAEKPRPEYIPLSFSQERLWFIDRLEGSTQYHQPAVLRLKGELNKDALAHTFRTVIYRHEVLRTVILEHDGLGYQRILPADDWTLTITENLADKETTGEFSSYLAGLISKPFDLSSDYMLRATLIKIDEYEHVLVVTMHHIASDGWSTSIMVKEVATLYQSYITGKEAVLPDLPVQYADYAIWQRKYMHGDLLEAKLAYWKTKLDGVATLQLPADYSRPAIQSPKGAAHSFSIDKKLAAQLQVMSQEHGATLYMSLLSAFKVLLYRYSGQEDICVGTPVAGRNQQELEGLIGFFINTLALRSQVTAEQSFTVLLQEIKATTLEAYAHQEVPFEKVVDAVVKTRDMSRSPLFQVMFSLQNTPDIPELKLGELLLSTATQEHTTTKFDIAFMMNESSSGIHGTVEYSTTLYKEDTIAAMCGHYINLLGSIVAKAGEQIGRLEMLTGSEEKMLLEEFSGTSAPYPKDKSIIALFEEQAAQTPESVAVIFEGQELNYKTLNERSNQLAHYLIKKGVKAETLVPICVERSLELIVGILGILKAGGAYVPIDLEYPDDRISYMLEDTGASIILSSRAGRDQLKENHTLVIALDDDWKLIAKESSANVGIKLSPDQLAYVMYTSGSSGRPKGVMIEHRSVVSLVKNAGYVSTGPEDNLLVTGSPSFDATTFEYWSMLLNGGKLILCTLEELLNSESLKANVSKHKVNIMWFTSSWFNQLADGNPEVFAGLRTVLVGGEKLSEYHIEKIKKLYPELELINGYGPTENTTFSLTYNITEIRQPIPIGHPLNNRSAYVLTPSGGLSPVGATGEIYLGGVGLARGYLNQPELTAEKFIKDPFSSEPNARLYKTGDFGRWLPDGNAEYLGRIDDQVKIRGYRIELGEIESVLNSNEQVSQGVVGVKEDGSGNKRLVGYVVASGTFDKQAVQAYLSTRLPEYMIPAVWVELDGIPLTRNGKVDKKALPDQDMTDMSHEYSAPRNETEQALADIWQELLGIDRAGIYDNFFEMGGHSLLAMRVVSAIRKELNIELAIKDLFIHPTIASLSVHLSEQSKEPLLPSIKAEERPEYIPLSFSQERLWFIDRLEGSTQYHLPAVLRLRGEIEPEILAHTLRTIINRHEVLRTVILEHDGLGYQQIMPADNWALAITESITEDESGLSKYVANLVSKPFDLSTDYMLRAELIKIEDNDYVLVVTMHHIASDGWSTSVLVKEVEEIYDAYITGREANLPLLPVQYADYAIWRRSYMHGEVLENKLNYWKTKLDNVTTLELPTDYSRQPVHRLRGATLSFSLDKQLASQVQSLGHRHGATLYMSLLAAFKVLLYRYSGQEDICIGTTVAGRPRQELEGLIGFFINMLALRNRVSGDMLFLDLLEEVKTTTLEAYGLQDVPFEKVVDAVVKTRDSSRSPLFQVMFSLQNTPEVPELKLGELQLSATSQEHTTTKFEIAFLMSETGSGIQGTVEYSTDLYKKETIELMISHYMTLLGSIVASAEEQIGRLAMLSGSEEQRLLNEFNDTTVNYPKDQTLVDLFEQQVAKTSEATAVIFENKHLSYKALNERSNQLARYLVKQGVKAETLVPICLERSLEMIIGILGIIKAGGAYVPVDPEYPQDRINYMLKDTGAQLVLSNTASKEKAGQSETIKVIAIDGDWQQIVKEESTNLRTPIQVSQIAYMIYTSGSTGRPKGAMNEHRGIVNRLLWSQDYFKLNSRDTILQKTTSSFDVSVWELFWPIITGAKLVFAKAGGQADSSYLKQIIDNENITLLHFVPSMLDAFLADVEPGDCKGLKNVLCSGEALTAAQVRLFDEKLPNIKLHNLYGPTEAAIDVTCWSHNKQEIIRTVPIGKPVANTRLYILNQDKQLNPIGVPGELYIGGIQVGRGYLNQPELTKEKFIKDDFSSDLGAKLYRTGDLARWQADGNIEYLGRVDDQVKIRGYRIELGEIESTLNQSKLVTQSVVLAKEDKQGTKRLVGYAVAVKFDKQAIRAYLSSKLPEYMVPALWVELDKIPLTPNGKIDRKLLPDPDGSLVEKGYLAPRNEIEQMMAEIWQEVLNIDEIGVTDDFFELGGHSLLAIRLVSAIRKTFGMELPISDVFVYRTVAGLAKQLESKSKTTSQLLFPIKGTGNKIPLYIICGAGGTIFKFVNFAKMFHPEQPVYGLQQPTDDKNSEEFPDTIEGIASLYLKEVLKKNPDGPYALSGHCLGGNIAFEMALQLREMGKEVALLAMIDSNAIEERQITPASFKNYYMVPRIITNSFSKILLKIRFEIFLLVKHPKQNFSYKIEKIRSILGISQPTPEGIEMESFNKVSKVFEKARRSYRTKYYKDEILVFYAKEHYYFIDRNKRILYERRSISNDAKNTWKEHAESVKFFEIEGEHSVIFSPKFGAGLADILQMHLDSINIVAKDNQNG